MYILSYFRKHWRGPVLFLLCAAICGAVFYLLASIWFLKRRAKFIDKDRFLAAGLTKWGRPKEL